jgi:uncharacterized membrane protein YhfC
MKIGLDPKRIVASYKTIALNYWVYSTLHSKNPIYIKYIQVLKELVWGEMSILMEFIE